MAPGPVELFLLAFPGTGEHGGIQAALDRARRLHDVRIVDALIVTRTTDGAVEAVELSDVDELTGVAAALGLTGGVPSDGPDPDALTGMDAEDAEEIGGALEPDTTALALLVEHVWATTLVGAAEESGPGPAAAVRIPTSEQMAAGVTGLTPPA